MTKYHIAYQPLPDGQGEENGSTSNNLKTPMPWMRRIFILIVLLSSAFNLVSIGMLLWRGLGRSVDPDPQVLYSPAQDVVEYKPIKFHSGFGSDLPIYDRPPSPAVDQAWEALYEFAVARIPKSQAVRLPNKTYPVLGDEGNYLVAIDVFHQLHCLNMVRMALRPDYYPLDSSMREHMGHCISSLRQSLMCSADISTIVWQWSERSHAAKERADVVHSCRDFDKIREWVKERNLVSVNTSVYIEDDLQIPTFYVD